MTLTQRSLKKFAIAAAAGLAMLTVAFIVKAQDNLPGPSPDAATQAATAEGEADLEVLTSGPVHEAFANPVTQQTDEGLVVPEAPPEPIDELPPKVVPEGQNVEWIPGYWAWNDEQNDFLWVSGLWRNVPPDQRWVPGHWVQVNNGHRWVSGFWTAAGSQNLEYLPYPPASQEYGPNVPAPGEGYFWMPGSWVFTNGEYQWRPGYWAHAHDDWCWIPQRYVWTPRGALYTPGYWDYRVPYRGTLFAPVRFGNRGFFRGGRQFTPGFVINPASLLVSLFVRPQYGHYYFGNYYGDDFYQLGYRPWYDASFGGRYRYDPLLAFYESYYDRRGVDFSGRVNQWFNFYEQNPDRRPPRTWSESLQLASRTDADVDTRLTIAQPLDEFVSGNDGIQRRFRQLTDGQRSAFAQVSKDFREVIQSRNRVEAETSADARVDADGRDADARGDIDARDGRQGRTGRGLQLPQVERRARDILGDAAAQRDQRAGQPDTQRPQTQPDQRRDRDNVAPGQQPQTPGQQARDGNRLLDRLRQPQPPQRPQNQPQPGDRPQLQNRPNPNAVPDNRGNIPNRGQANQPQGARQPPSRNIFQPRRGNFPQQGDDANRGQQFRTDPRDAIPQFRGRGNAQPNQPRGQGALQGRGQSGNAPAAGNRGNRGGGSRGNSGNRGNNNDRD